MVKRNKYMIVGILIIIAIVLGVIGFNKKEYNNEEVIERQVVEKHTLYLKINPLVKILYEETYKTCNNEICGDIESKVQELSLLNNDAEKIYNEINIIDLDIYASISKLINVARENNIDVTNVTLTYDSLHFNKEKISAKDSVNISGGYSKTIDESALMDNKIQYTVSFNSNGGSTVIEQSVFEGDKATEPINPVRDGYKFIEWQLGNSKYDFEQVVINNLELIAKWEEIVLNNQNSVNTSNEHSHQNNTTNSNSNSSQNTSSNSEVEQNKDNNNNNNNVTEENNTVYTVTFNSNGGSTVKSQNVKNGQKVIEPDAPTKNGYKFIEWQLNGIPYYFDENIVTSDLTLTAFWLPDTRITEKPTNILFTNGFFEQNGFDDKRYNFGGAPYELYIKWNAVKNADNYIVLFSTTLNGTYEKVGSTSEPQTVIKLKDSDGYYIIRASKSYSSSGEYMDSEPLFVPGKFTSNISTTSFCNNDDLVETHVSNAQNLNYIFFKHPVSYNTYIDVYYKGNADNENIVTSAHCVLRPLSLASYKKSSYYLIYSTNLIEINF